MIRGYDGFVALSFLDPESGQSFSVAGTAPVPAASTIKLLVLSTLMRKAEEGVLCLADRTEITAELRTGGDGILKELEPGHSFSLEELAVLMIIVSDNMAANILIDRLGMDAVNEEARRLDLKQTVLARKMMDAAARSAGRENRTCAEDLTEILRRLYTGTLVSPEADRKMLSILLRQQQKGRLQLYLPDEILLAHKCGDLHGVENDCGIFFTEPHPYILTVLTRGFRSNADSRRCIGEISKYIYENMWRKV